MDHEVIINISILLLFLFGITLTKDTFVIGICPHISSLLTLKQYLSLHRHLENKLGMSVTIMTAPDSDTFVKIGITQEYDIVISTYQHAQLVQVTDRYIPLLPNTNYFKSDCVCLLHEHNAVLKKKIYTAMRQFANTTESKRQYDTSEPRGYRKLRISKQKVTELCARTTIQTSGSNTL